MSTKIPWNYPMTVFARNPLSTDDKCLACTATSVTEFTTSSRCSIEAKGECERKGGKYCPGPKIKVCYLFLKEEVSSFQEAADLCDKYDAEFPVMSIRDYVRNFRGNILSIFLNGILFQRRTSVWLLRLWAWLNIQQ
ncbi:hypothetical protein Anas_05414 [Armadillidium nasatum]|uniref:C-type lectin domain-containing protein n=1 Tax=Armadillidium nasatum TaxID=96803 RepID=A0A5N5TN76_9CRUS|nr:hypothetical protein Anas_05414 [Armadillidium nasatum]